MLTAAVKRIRSAVWVALSSPQKSVLGLHHSLPQPSGGAEQVTFACQLPVAADAAGRLPSSPCKRGHTCPSCVHILYERSGWKRVSQNPCYGTTLLLSAMHIQLTRNTLLQMEVCPARHGAHWCLGAVLGAVGVRMTSASCRAAAKWPMTRVRIP